jgi:hypothetical protein
MARNPLGYLFAFFNTMTAEASQGKGAGTGSLMPDPL